MDWEAPEFVEKLSLALEGEVGVFHIALVEGIQEKKHDMIRTGSVKNPTPMEKRLDDWEAKCQNPDKKVQRTVKARKRDYIELLAMVTKVVEEEDKEEIEEYKKRKAHSETTKVTIGVAKEDEGAVSKRAKIIGCTENGGEKAD